MRRYHRVLVWYLSNNSSRLVHLCFYVLFHNVYVFVEEMFPFHSHIRSRKSMFPPLPTSSILTCMHLHCPPPWLWLAPLTPAPSPFSAFTPLSCVSHPPLPLSSYRSPFLVLGCTHTCWHVTLIVPAVLILTVNDRMPRRRGGGGIKIEWEWRGRM